MRFQVFLSLWSVTSWLCIDKIPEVAKTKVSKPKRYSLSKLRFCHAPLKRLIQTRPHMFTSRCGNIYVRRGFSNRSSVDAVMTGRRCEQQRIWRPFHESRRGGNSDFAVTIWCFVISLSICYWLFQCGVFRVVCMCVCVCERERERERVTAQRLVCVCVCESGRHSHTTAACLQTHTSFITVSVTRLCSPLGLELMVKLRTLLTVFNFESWSSRLWKGALHFRRGLWYSANHNALGQLANQSRLRLSEGGTL